MSNSPATNADRFNALMARLAKAQVFELDGKHGDNLCDMLNRHHHILSAFADYIEEEAKAFNWETGAQIDLDLGSILDGVFRDEIASVYQRERDEFRSAPSKPSAYDRGRNQREAA